MINTTIICHYNIISTIAKWLIYILSLKSDIFISVERCACLSEVLFKIKVSLYDSITALRSISHQQRCHLKKLS